MQIAECKMQSAERTSAICNLQSAICILVLCLAPSVGRAQSEGIGPTTFRDSLVMRQMIYRAPCPNPVPPAWSRIDSTLRRPPGCAIVETAARALSEMMRMRPGMQTADPWNPFCVRVLMAKNPGSTGLTGDWIVIFDLTPDNRARVVIDRQSGTVGGVQMEYGSAVSDNQPKCLPG